MRFKEEPTLVLKTEVMNFKEEGVCFSYLPALDISGYGNNYKEADALLEAVLKEFIGKAGTKSDLLATLNRMGWKKSKNGVLHAPLMADLIKHSEPIRHILEIDFSKKSKIYTFVL